MMLRLLNRTQSPCLIKKLVAALTVLAMGILMLPATPSVASAAHLPTNCQGAPNGDLTISPDGSSAFTVFCQDEKEYLTLEQTGGSFNFGQFTTGGVYYGQSVRTNFTRIRLDPATLLVDGSDYTFSSTTGQVWRGAGTITVSPYAVAHDCRTDWSKAGLANIDLRGTTFAVDTTFRTGGWNPNATVTAGGTTYNVPYNGTIVHISGEQVVDLTGGGYCGGVGPDTGSLQLMYIGPELVHDLDVDIDIKPGDDVNAINPKSKGNISVAILSGAGFDATTDVARESLTFGATGDEASLQLRGGRNAVPNCGVEDVDGDGLPDLVCHFDSQTSDFGAGDTEGILKGQTTEGINLLGRDAVRTVGK